MAEDPSASLTSIVLPAYVPTDELLEVTKKCLSSLENTTEAGTYELVVIDNGSTPKASEVLWSWSDRYLRYEEPIGYARAANVGLATANRDWLMVLNTDIEFREAGWLERLRSDYLRTEGGVLAAMDEKGLSDPSRRAKMYGGIYYDWSWFSCWLTERRVVQEVGYFDESMGYRFHDQDYAIRVTRAGYRVMRDPKVMVGHIDSATYDTMGRGDDPGEKAILKQRWGAEGFTEWLMQGQQGPAA